MNPAVIGVFVPIILFLVIGLVMISSAYFNYRVRQTLVDKGLDPQSIREFLEHKRGPLYPYEDWNYSHCIRYRPGIGPYTSGSNR